MPARGPYTRKSAVDAAGDDSGNVSRTAFGKDSHALVATMTTTHTTMVQQ